MKTSWKNNFKKAATSNLAFLVLAAFFVLAVWAIAYVVVRNHFVIPSPVDTVKEAFLLFAETGFWRAFTQTILRVLFAFLISLALGLVFGFISYLYPLFLRFFTPIIAVLRSLPTLAITLVILLWTSPKSAPVVVAICALFPTLYTAVLNGLKGVDDDLVELCDVYRVPFGRRLKQLYFPTLSVRLYRDGAAALSFALKLIVSAEVLSNTFLSLGSMMQSAAYSYLTARLFALVLVVCVLGLIVETLGGVIADKAERRAL